MGIIQVITNSVSNTFADQYKEVVTTSKFNEHSLVVPGIIKNNKNNNYTDGIISNGSIIYVPENTAAFIFSKLGIENIITQPGGYKYENGTESILNGDGVINSIIKEVGKRIVFSGESSDYKRIAYVNLREIRDIKFGTKGPQLYNDKFYDADLEITAYGSYNIQIVDSEKFIKNFVPAGVDDCSIDDDGVKSGLASEFLQSFIVALNSLSKNYRISQIPSQANELSKEILNDNDNAGTWIDRFGLAIRKVNIENIEFTDKSRELVNKYSENKLNLKAYEDISQRASNISAQQKIAEGIKENGLGEGGNMIFGMNMAQALNPNGQQKNTTDFDSQVENLKKLKELFDAGILTEEEFNIKKKEIMGL